MSATSYTAAGQVETTTDRFGNVSETRYDTRGNVVETRTPVKDAAGTEYRLVTRTAYDANGRAVAASDPFIVDHTSGDALITPAADLRLTRTIYDDLGRVIATERYAGLAIMITPEPGTDHYDTDEPGSYPTANLLSRSETHYDAAGRVAYTLGNAPGDPADSPSARSDLYYAAAARQVAVLGPEVEVVGLGTVRTLSETTYDAAGRQRSSTTGVAILDTTPGFAARPSLADLQNATYRDDTAAQTTAFTYDALGRVTHTTQRDWFV